jgi:hypothetical protein
MNQLVNDVMIMRADSEIEKDIGQLEAAVELVEEQLAALRRRLSGTGRIASARPASAEGKKSPPSGLHITLGNQLIDEAYAADALVKAIELLGPARVKNLGLRLGGRALVVDAPPPGGRSYRRSGSHWIATHSDTDEKRVVIEEICRRMGLNCIARKRSRN